MAALQVVYRRLKDAHLRDFCLLLHNYKANKREILQQIGANLELKQTKVRSNALSSLEELTASRKKLSLYATQLHKRVERLKMSCYEVFVRLCKVNDADSITFSFDSPADVARSRLQGFITMLNSNSFALQRIDYRIKNNPWEGLQSRSASYDFTPKMTEVLSLLRDIRLP